MSTVYRHTLTDGTVPLEKVAEIQIQSMVEEAAIVGKSLTNITMFWTGTIAEAIDNPELQQYLPPFTITQSQSNQTIVVHSADVVEDGVS